MQLLGLKVCEFHCSMSASSGNYDRALTFPEEFCPIFGGNVLQKFIREDWELELLGFIAGSFTECMFDLKQITLFLVPEAVYMLQARGVHPCLCTYMVAR